MYVVWAGKLDHVLVYDDYACRTPYALNDSAWHWQMVSCKLKQL
jgi:hypothetical protein